MKRIVVTGAKGGAGTGIASVLQERGYEVVRTDLHPWTNAEAAGYVQLDLRQAEGVNDVFAGADGVIHFGSPPADAWFSTTEAFHHVTVAGFNVFQAAKNVGIKRIAWASSIEAYGDFKTHASLPATEESPLAPPGIYGSSKIILERLAQDYCRWHGMSIAGFRLSRIIYDSDSGRAKLKQIVEDEGWGQDCLWSYIDARDVATACIAWLEADQQGAEEFNLAAENIHQEANTIDLLQKYGYTNFSIAQLETPDATLFSTAKIRSMLDWKAEYDWRDIIST